MSYIDAAESCEAAQLAVPWVYLDTRPTSSTPAAIVNSPSSRRTYVGVK